MAYRPRIPRRSAPSRRHLWKFDKFIRALIKLALRISASSNAAFIKLARLKEALDDVRGLKRRQQSDRSPVLEGQAAKLPGGVRGPQIYFFLPGPTPGSPKVPPGPGRPREASNIPIQAQLGEFPSPPLPGGVFLTKNMMFF